MSKHYIPKLTIELEEEQYFRLKNHLDYGELRPLMSAIVDDINDLIDEYGNMIVAVVAGKQVKPREVLPSLNKAERVCKQIQEEESNE